MSGFTSLQPSIPTIYPLKTLRKWGVCFKSGLQNQLNLGQLDQTLIHAQKHVVRISTLAPHDKNHPRQAVAACRLYLHLLPLS